MADPMYPPLRGIVGFPQEDQRQAYQHPEESGEGRRGSLHYRPRHRRRGAAHQDDFLLMMMMVEVVLALGSEPAVRCAPQQQSLVVSAPAPAPAPAPAAVLRRRGF